MVPGISSGGALTNSSVTDVGYSGAITLAATSSIGSNNAGDITIYGIISGSNGLTKVGNGTLILSGANTFTGSTNISLGTVKLGASSSLSSSGPLGTTAAGTTVSTGASLDLNGYSLTSAATEALSLTGTGVGGLGALMNSSSTASTYVGIITFAAAASIVGDGATIAITEYLSVTQLLLH